MLVYVIEMASGKYQKGNYLNTQHMLYEWHTSGVVYSTLEAAMVRVERDLHLNREDWCEAFDAMTCRAWVIEKSYNDFWTATRIIELEVLD